MEKPKEMTLAVRILERLVGRVLHHTDVGRPIRGEMPMGQLRRALNAYRHPGWDDALDLCQRCGAITIDLDSTVRVVSIPRSLFPPPPRAGRRSAGRYRSEKDRAARRTWVEQKPQERGEDLVAEDEPREDIKEWLAGQQMQSS